MSAFVRKIDELGRIVLPMELRKVLNIDTKCDIELEVKNGTIILTPRQTLCRCCGTTIPSKTKYNLCAACIKTIKEDHSIG